MVPSGAGTTAQASYPHLQGWAAIGRGRKLLEKRPQDPDIVGVNGSDESLARDLRTTEDSLPAPEILCDTVATAVSEPGPSRLLFHI